jgi:hypothetical protein
MSAPLPSRPDPETFEAFLEGRLSGAEAAAVEEAIRRDPVLAAELELQERIDGSLKRLFDPPALDVPAPAPIPFVRSAPAARRWGWMAMAAAVVLCAGGLAWFALQRPGAGAAGMYQRLAATGYKPDWVCETDAIFSQFTSYQLGEAFLVKATPTVALIGWVYEKDVLGPRGAALMATVEGEHVVVVVDRVQYDRKVETPPKSGLNVFRRQIGALVFYEVTPRSEPGVLDLIYRPDAEQQAPIP